MRIRAFGRAGLALVAGGAVAVTMAGLPAVGQESPPSTTIIMAKMATLFDRGVGATIKIRATCNSGDQGQVGVTLSERSGRKITQGSGYQTFNCTGGIETVTVTVVVGNGGPYGGSAAPFVVGTAYGQSYMEDCSPNYFCNQTGESNHNVKLERAKKTTKK